MPDDVLHFCRDAAVRTDGVDDEGGAVELGRSQRRALGLGLCVVGIVAGATFSHQEPASPSLVGVSADVTDAGATGSLAATVSWPSGAEDLDRSDICMVLIDEAGGVFGENGDSLEPVPGEPVAARWTVDGLAAGRYTLYAAQCVTPRPRERVWVEPQYLGGATQADAAWWVEISDGTQVDVGTIALHRAGLVTWPRHS